MNRQEQLFDDYLHGILDEIGWEELQQWLKTDDAHMRQFVRELMLEEEIRDAVHAKDGADSAKHLIRFPDPSPQKTTKPRPSSGPDISTRSRFARAAAWLGAFTWFGKKTQAAGTATSTILMTKPATTAITAAALITGAGAAYYIHHQNRQTEARIGQLESQQVTHKSSVDDVTSQASLTATRAGTNAGASALLEKWRKLHEVGPSNMAEAAAYMNDLNAMDAAALKELLLEAERMGDLPSKLVFDILLRLAKKAPADATIIGTRLVNHAPKFNDNWADYVGKAFGRWLEQDPAAAHAWYVKEEESGQLTPKSIPQEGEDRWSPDRLLAGIRLAALFKTNLPEAEAMMSTMRPDDAARGINALGDPALIAQLMPRLPAEHQYMAASTYVNKTALADPAKALAWIAALETDASTRDKLVILAVTMGQESNKLGLDDISRQLNSLPISDESVPELLLRAATGASLVPRKGWQWDTMGERITWLRRNLPPEQAEATVGRLLGTLARSDIDKAMEVYQQETGASSSDPHLRAEFAKGISEWGNKQAIAEALRIVETLPEGELRETTKAAVEKNRR